MIIVAMQFELTRPAMLVTLLALPFLYWYFRCSLVDFERWQRITSLVIRGIILALLALALAGLHMMRPTRQQFVVVAVDQSLSVNEEAQEQALQYLAQLEKAAGSNELAYVTFAAKPNQATKERPVSVAQSPGSVPTENAAATELDSSGGANEESSADPDATEVSSDTAGPLADKSSALEAAKKARLGTDLEAAIEVAIAAIPPFYVPQLVVITDGNETHGDAVRAALAGDVPVSTIPLPSSDDPEVQVASVTVPAQVRQGEPFYVEVIVDANHDDQGRIEVYRGDVKVDLGDSEQVKVKSGETRFRFRQEATDQRQVNYAVRISRFQDTLLDNNTASGLVSASGKPRILLVDSDPNTTDPLRWALEEQDIRVDVRPPEGAPSSLADLQSFEAIMLSNVPATSLTIRQMEVMRTYVQDLGGGLLMLGGDQSFGLGGYYKTTLEEILPVRSNFEKEKEKPSIAMVLVIDRSGSMGGMKIELAKDAAKSAVELLGPRDQIGIIAFDSSPNWVSELHSAADKNYVIERISTIESGGGTSIYPAMVEAYTALQSAVAKLKHVIVLTDGHSSPGDFEGITSNMVSNRMTVSTVGVGSGADANLLETIARQGSGRYYFCEDPQSIPQIFAKETVTASKSAINEQPFVPQLVRPTPVLSSLDIESAPFLLGYVVTRPKPTCEYILATESGDPLLAWWRYGLGVTVAFTSDAKSRWAAEWISWPDFGTFWAQVIRNAMRKSEAKGVYVEVESIGDMTRVKLDAVDANGRYRNQAATNLSIIRPNLNQEKQELSMQQVAPGRYVAEFESEEEGPYFLDLSQQVGAQVAFHQTRGMVKGYPDELRLRATNKTLLQKIAEVSGGRYDPQPEDIFDIGEETAQQAKALWPYLLGAALCLFLFDVAFRRIDFSLLLGR